MFNLQGSEIIVILLIALVVLGPERLPDAVRRFTQTYNELKKMGSGFQSEIKTAFEEPLKELRDTAAVVRDAADPTKLIAEAEAEQRLRDEAHAGNASPAADVSANGHEPDHRANGWARPQVPVVDPGSETVATPGSPPSSPTSSASPPPPPPPVIVPARTVDPPPLPRRREDP